MVTPFPEYESKNSHLLIMGLTGLKKISGFCQSTRMNRFNPQLSYWLTVLYSTNSGVTLTVCPPRVCS